VNRQDYFTPVRYEPPQRTPRNLPKPPRGLWIVLAAALVILAVGGGVFLMFQRQQQRSAAETAAARDVTIPPAEVLQGKPLKWRTLASFDWEADIDHPRPVFCTGRFSGGAADEVLLIDFAGATQIISLDGKSTTVKDAKWGALAQFTAWDVERDGKCELVPDTLFFAYQPKVKSYVRIRGTG